MRKFYLGTVALFLVLSFSSLQAAIILNEIMPCNVSTVMNKFQNYTGWVEVYNNGTNSENLRGYTFANVFRDEETGKNDTLRWTVSGDLNVAAGEYRLIFFDDNEQGAVDHATYKIETEGGCLILYDNAKRELNRLCYDRMMAHVSWGRAGGVEGYMANPTPGRANAQSLSNARRVQKPTFGRAPGFYDGSTTVTLQSESNAAIYYTTNGSEPTKESTLYTGPISVSKTTVIRARAYMDNRILSDIAAGTYIFNRDIKDKEYHSSCNGFTVPIVSISTNSDNFFNDQMGIYVTGTNGIAGPGCDPKRANYRQDWKRPIHFEFFVDKKQVVSQELDAAVMGGCSRQYTQKSLKINASKKLGNNKIAGVDGLLYDFFPWEKTQKDYKSVMLRNGGNNYDGSRIRDAFMQSIPGDRMNVDCQTHRPVAFYINGEYWGHSTMMIRHNKDFVYTNYGMKNEDIDLLEMSSAGVDVSEGNKAAYDKMIAEAKNNPTAADYYDRMNRLMDIDNYIDYQIFEQFIGNTDWPGNNMKLWRENKTGRFRWIVVDTDFGFGLYGAGGPNYCGVDHNMINWALGQGPTNWANEKAWMVELFSNLMKNEKFRQRFLNRYILHLGTTFAPERVIGLLNKVRNDSRDEVCAHRARFTSFYMPSITEEINSMSDFARIRPGNVYNHLRDYFKLGSLIDLKISANISNADFIVNDERINASKFEGKYFKDSDLKVQPIAPAGYRFTGWNLTSSSVAQTMLDKQTQWKYYNKGEQPAGNWIVNSYDDSGWETGTCTFGYATDNRRTYDTPLGYGGDPENKWITTYFRTSFDIANVSAIDEIQCTMVYDDGVVIYVNGKELPRRFNMPAGEISYSTFAINAVNDETVTFTIDKSFLQNGKNVIAVEVHQVSVASSDVTFKLDMTGRVNSSGTSNQAYNAKVTGDLNLVATFEKVTYQKPKLFINELCASNGKKSGFHDGYGNYGDWIEIYNAEDVAVDLGGMYIEENSKKITYQFPTFNPFETTVPAKGYKIVWASKLMAQGAMHVNFKLTAGSASTLVLYEMVDNRKEEIDRVSYPKEVGTRNESYGRVTDGSPNWVFFEYCEEFEKYLATPERKNGSEKCEAVSVEEILSAGSTVAMKLYPNPAKTFLSIAVNTFDTYTLQIYDDKGRLVENTTVNEDVATLNVQGYASGIYIIKVITNEAVLQQKFIKQ